MKTRLWRLRTGDGIWFKAVVVASLITGWLIPAVAVRGDDVTILAKFAADKGPGYRKPNPDAAGAVGPKHSAVLDDRGFVVQDKATGKVLQNDTQHDFWLKVQPAGTLDLLANDPRLLSDPLVSPRWFSLGPGTQGGPYGAPGRFHDLPTPRSRGKVSPVADSLP